MSLATQSAPVIQADHLDALLHQAAFAPLDDTGWLRVTGSDRVRWLNGMVTNSIQELAPGQGCYNFLLNAQGRIQGDAFAFAKKDSLLLETASPGSVATLLDWFIIMDDVELEVVSSSRPDAIALQKGYPSPTDWIGLLVAGPKSDEFLSAIQLTARAPISLTSNVWQGNSLNLVAAYSPLVPRYELWSDTATIAAVRSALIAIGAIPVGPSALEALRILEGTPRYGIDIRNSETARDLPQETNQTHALHFAKGCYLGQEIVERIRSRGQVHRTFTGFRLIPDQPGELPPTGTALSADGKPIGELTSTATLPFSDGPAHLALGYIRREALDRNYILTYPGGHATPTPLPFKLPGKV